MSTEKTQCSQFVKNRFIFGHAQRNVKSNDWFLYEMQKWAEMD